MDPLPCSINLALLEVGVHALPRWVLPRQHAPLTATHDNVQDRIDDRSHLQAARSSSRLCRRDQFFDTIPLTVGQIGGIPLVLFHSPSVPPRSLGCHPFSNRLLESFDLLHLSFLTGSMPVTAFPQLVRDVRRLCRRGDGLPYCAVFVVDGGDDRGGVGGA